tara:strand:- start:1757 stop:3805 length:2049 start_codon:yes stop_codon:yes gene_type:complete
MSESAMFNGHVNFNVFLEHCLKPEQHQRLKTYLDNLPKPPRKWQRVCAHVFLQKYNLPTFAGNPSFVAACAPATGKSYFFEIVARFLLNENEIDTIVVVSPTRTKRDEWFDQFLENEPKIEFRPRNGKVLYWHPNQTQHTKGFSITYAGLCPIMANENDLNDFKNNHRDCRMLVGFDEFHHCGTNQWGKGVQELFGEHYVKALLMMTGTPFRFGKDVTFPFVNRLRSDKEPDLYDMELDFEYLFPQALRDGVVTGVEVNSVDGIMHCTRKGLEWTHLLSSMRISKLLRQANGSANAAIFTTINGVESLVGCETIDKGVKCIMNMIRNHKPFKNDTVDATLPPQVLFVCTNTKHANAVAGYLGEKHTDLGEITTVHSKQDVHGSSCSKVIKDFRFSKHRNAIVTVNMVSEGVNNPRLKVLVFLSMCKTRLYIVQVFNRVTRTYGPHYKKAVVYQVADPEVRKVSDYFMDETRKFELDMLEEEKEDVAKETNKEELPDIETNTIGSDSDSSNETASTNHDIAVTDSSLAGHHIVNHTTEGSSQGSFDSSRYFEACKALHPDIPTDSQEFKRNYDQLKNSYAMEKPPNKRQKISDLPMGEQLMAKRTECNEFIRTIHRRLERRTGKRFSRGLVISIAYKKVQKKWGIVKQKKLTVLDQLDTLDKLEYLHSVILPRVDKLLKEKYH